MSNFMPVPSPSPGPSAEAPSQAPDDKGLWGHIADVADFLFATKSLNRLLTGGGGWGDLGIIGITAASFFIPPVRLLKFSIKPLESIIVHAAEVAASDTASVAAKRLAEKTAENARYLLENPGKHEELVKLADTAGNAEITKLNNFHTQADEFLTSGTVPEPPVRKVGEIPLDELDPETRALLLEAKARKDFVVPDRTEPTPAALAERSTKFLPKVYDEQGLLIENSNNGISRQLYEEGLTATHPDAFKPDTFLKDISLSADEMRMGTKYPEYPHLDQEFVDQLRVKGFTEQNIWKVNIKAGKLDDRKLAGGINNTETRRLLFKNKEEYDKFLNEPGQDINLKGEKLDWSVKKEASMDEDGNLVLTELEDTSDKLKPLSMAEFIGIVPTPKRLGSAAKSYPSELQADVGNSASNWLNAKIFGTSEQIAKAERLYNADKDALKKALNSSRITPHAAMAIKKQHQKDLVDKIFKLVVPEFKPKNPYKLSTSKKLTPTSEINPTISPAGENLGYLRPTAKKVTVFERINHVKNILKKEQTMFLPESKQYKQLIKSNYNLDDPEQLAKYAETISKYEYELVSLKELQVKSVESVQSFVKDLDDNGVRYFVKMLGSKSQEELELLDSHAYINLLRDIYRHTKADDVKRSVSTLGKRLVSIQEDLVKKQNKLEMEKRISRTTSLSRNEETLAKVQAMAKPKVEKSEVVSGLSREERMAATKAKVDAMVKTEPIETTIVKSNKAADDEVFVFGSNLEGRHGKGAALEAKEKFGAKYGQARGRQGQSYAIPTKDLKINKGLSLDSIKKDIDEFFDYAEAHPDEKFFFSAIGTGLAGHSPKDIAALISRMPDNVRFDPKIGDLIGK